MSHFTAFGIPIAGLTTESDVLKQVIADVHQTGGWHRSPDGQLTSCTWIDPSSCARLDLLLTPDHQVVCATPQLEGCRGSQVVRMHAVLDEKSAGNCPGCAVVEAELLLASGQVRPITFAPADIAPHREHFEAAAAQLATVQVAMVLVVEAVSRRGSSDSGRTTLLQVNQLSGPRSRATVRATCQVTAIAERVTSFGHRFWYLQVECLEHCLDLVADPAVLPTVRVGDLLKVSAWVCGQAWW